MSESVYVNSFISNGMTAFFNKSRDFAFESHIVECLCDIYGFDRIKSAFEAKDENAFSSILHVYGLSQSVYDNFLRDTVRYQKFKEENAKDPSIKSDLGSKIEVGLISMFLYKCLVLSPSLEEISHFENNLLNNFEVIKLHFNTSLNPNQTREVWEKKKRLLTDNVELVEIKPELLDANIYQKYGANIDDVKKMDYRMVEELNNYIKSKEALEVETPKEAKPKKNKLIQNTVLSTGNGFVDAIIIAAIVAAEMSIGIIYLFLNL